MWLGDARHRHRRRDAEEDQQRRHQEAAADAEHAGDEADREPHRQDDEDVDRQVGDRKIDLHGVRSFGSRLRAFRAQRQLVPVREKGDESRPVRGAPPATAV